MTKQKKPGILFFIMATLFNLAVTVLFFFGILALWGLVLAPLLRLPSSAFVILAAFVLSVAGSAFVYKAALKIYARRTGGEMDNPLTKS